MPTSFTASETLCILLEKRSKWPAVRGVGGAVVLTVGWVGLICGKVGGALCESDVGGALWKARWAGLL